MENKDVMSPLFNLIESRKPTPLERMASLREAQNQLGIQGIDEQQQGIAETKAQLEELQKNAPDAKQQKITMALLAAGDILGNTGGKALQLHQMFAPKDTSKQQTALQKLLAQQRQGLSKAELGLIDQQLSSQYQDAQLELLGKKVTKGKERDPLKDEKTRLEIDKIKAENEKTAKAKEASSERVKNVGKILIRDIGGAKDIIDKSGSYATTLGGIPGLIPGTSPNVLRKHIDSVKGNIAVDQLTQMKKDKVGLGQVPQSQLNMLSTLMGSLEPDLPPDILKENLQQIEDIYAEIVRKEGGDPFELYEKALNRKAGGSKTKTPPQYKNPESSNLAKELGL